MKITLVWESAITINGNGFPTTTKRTATVYATELSVTRLEAYESMRAGNTVQRVFEVRSEDYEMSKHTDSAGRVHYADFVQVDDATYSVVRSFKKGRTGKVEISVK